MDKRKHEKSILKNDVDRAERAVIPPLAEDKLVHLPKGNVMIDIPEFHKTNYADENSESSEQTDDSTYFNLHAEMESKERLRFIGVVQSLAPRNKNEESTLGSEYYSNTQPSELIESYKKIPPLEEPMVYMDKYHFNHCTHHVQPGVGKYIHPPVPPKLIGEWKIKRGNNEFDLLIQKTK
ncbi:Uncharacterized protein QTN25_005619 [Entamoeba marina]